jgi:hypothetical protein
VESVVMFTGEVKWEQPSRTFLRPEASKSFLIRLSLLLTVIKFAMSECCIFKDLRGCLS